jgi:molecular chaperone HtpG
VATALWSVSKSELKKEDYIEFYKTLSHGDDEPLEYLHNKVEGSHEFTTLFYIPKKAPMDLYRADYQSGVKLYVKRVFITDDDKELLPTYLRFMRGIIDSEDLPLNVSREILQENRILANIRQSTTKKILQTIKKFSTEKMEIFTKEYNRVIKEGIFQDHTNKELLLEIVRYKSSSVDGMVSLDDYMSRGDSEKKIIYYIVGENEQLLKNSPLLEAYNKASIEVLVMDDKEVDEIVTPAIGEFKGWRFQDITATDAPESKSVEEKEKLNEEFKSLTDKIKAILGDEIKEVKTTTRLTLSPSCILKDSSDPMASMAYLFRQMGQELPATPMILEINPEHEMIIKMNSLNDESTFSDVAWILLDSAKISEGIDVSDKIAFAQRVARVATKAI